MSCVCAFYSVGMRCLCAGYAFWMPTIKLTAACWALSNQDLDLFLRHHCSLFSPSIGALFRSCQINGEGGIPFSTKLAAGLRSAARNYKATRLLTRPG